MKKSLPVIGLLALAAVAHADPAYVSDKLVVSVYAEANQDSDKIETLESGAQVDAMEKNEGYTHVKLTDGREGWIKSTYLTAQAPAIVRVKELERASSAPSPKLQEELKQLQAENGTLRGEVDSLKKAAAAARAQPVVMKKDPEPVTIHTEEAPSQLNILSWGAASTIMGGLIGFGLGYRSLAKRIRDKYGNLKIY
jgi:SH3 domain protein